MANKVHCCITLDSEVLDLAKAKQINKSAVINEFLKDYLLVDESKIPNEKDLLNREIAEHRAETRQREARLKIIEDKEKEDATAKLKAQQDHAEKVRTGKIEYL